MHRDSSMAIFFALEGEMESQGKPGSFTSPRLLTAEDVGQIKGLPTETLTQWRIKRKGIPFLKPSRNVVRYRQGDLDLRPAGVECASMQTPIAGRRTWPWLRGVRKAHDAAIRRIREHFQVLRF